MERKGNLLVMPLNFFNCVQVRCQTSQSNLASNYFLIVKMLLKIKARSHATCKMMCYLSQSHLLPCHQHGCFKLSFCRCPSGFSPPEDLERWGLHGFSKVEEKQLCKGMGRTHPGTGTGHQGPGNRFPYNHLGPFPSKGHQPSTKVKEGKSSVLRTSKTHSMNYSVQSPALGDQTRLQHGFQKPSTTSLG